MIAGAVCFTQGRARRRKHGDPGEVRLEFTLRFTSLYTLALLIKELQDGDRQRSCFVHASELDEPLEADFIVERNKDS